MKIVPQLYNFVRMSGKKSMLETKFLTQIPTGLRYSKGVADSFVFSTEECEAAYKEYEKSPYINSYLRTGEPLSETQNELILKLKQLITTSLEVTGKFIRGLTPNKSKLETEDDVAKYIFDNKGFTSTTPFCKENFANCFTTKDGATVVFDLKEPTKAIEAANGYEVIFGTKAFSRNKYEITKIGDRRFKVTEKPKSSGISYCYSHKDKGGTVCFSSLPDDYVDICKTTEWVEATPAHTSKFGRIVKHHEAQEAHYETYETRTRKPYYHIDKLQSGEKGYGTRAIQGIVQESLDDKNTQGRVLLECCNIEDKRPCPAGFYYKLGFRFPNQFQNEPFEKWIKDGGKRKDAPIDYGEMYLPKENIKQCLEYITKNFD